MCMQMHHTFLYIFQPLLHDCNLKLPNFTHPLMECQWTQHKIFLFLFLNLDTVLFDSTTENFVNIWQIKWNWIRWMKFETGWIPFLIDVFGLLWSRNIATITMATWCNNFPSLLEMLATQARINYASLDQNETKQQFMLCLELSLHILPSLIGCNHMS